MYVKQKLVKYSPGVFLNPLMLVVKKRTYVFKQTWISIVEGLLKYAWPFVTTRPPSIDLLIFDAIQQVKLCQKSPDSLGIFKEISKARAKNFTEEDIEDRIEGFINKNKLANNKTGADLILSLWHHL